jgi:hypothetical protein
MATGLDGQWTFFRSKYGNVLYFFHTKNDLKNHIKTLLFHDLFCCFKIQIGQEKKVRHKEH